MKIRNGFVSNSSTSSFICDTNDTLEEVRRKMEAIAQLAAELDIKCGYIVFKADKDYAKGWEEYYPEIVDARNCQHIVIEGTTDNSIDYALHNFIEKIFNAERIHLG